MARLNPGRFAFGLIAEITGIVVIVTILPRIPWGGVSLADSPEVIADQRPSLIPTAPVAARRQEWREAARQKLEPESIPPVDPVYVERRLDRAGQQLLSGVSNYVVETARQVLESPQPLPPSAAASVPPSAVRPFPPRFISPDFTGTGDD